MDFSSRPLGAKKTENEKTEVEEEKKSSLFFTFFFSNLDPSLFSLSLSLSLSSFFFGFFILRSPLWYNIKKT